MIEMTWEEYVLYVNAAVNAALNGWHVGPPPSIGWWPASIYGEIGVLRFWDGQFWSWPVDKTCDMIEVATMAERPSSNPNILWTQRPADWAGRGDA